MNTLSEFLKSVKTTFLENSFCSAHIVIGNESCDLDSTVSSLILAYFLYKCGDPQIPNSDLIIPILNVSEENFLLRRDICFVLEKCGISLKSLIYRNEVNIEELVKRKQITTTLVDHHVLTENNCMLEETVIQIFDHRPHNNENIEGTMKEVGSCSTLIADKIFQRDKCFLNEYLAYMIYGTIIMDTGRLSPEFGKAKELDESIAKKLKETYNFDADAIYKQLHKLHTDVSGLSAKEMLLKDLKIVRGIPVAKLEMLVEQFLKLNDACESVENKATEEKSSLLMLVGSDKGRRDIGIFWEKRGEGLKENLLHVLYNSKKLKGYDFEFEENKEVSTQNVLCLRQNNAKLTRKQIVPLIECALSNKGN